MVKVISANRLTDGTVVYLGPDGHWVEALGAALTFVDDAATQTGLAVARTDEKRNLIVEPFGVDVSLAAEGLKAQTLRNAIRANGPTIPYRSSVPPAGSTERS
jgi:hypothetical protein